VDTCLIILSLGACAAVKYEHECLVCTTREMRCVMMRMMMMCRSTVRLWLLEGYDEMK